MNFVFIDAQIVIEKSLFSVDLALPKIAIIYSLGIIQWIQKKFEKNSLKTRNSQLIIANVLGFLLIKH